MSSKLARAAGLAAIAALAAPVAATAHPGGGGDRRGQCGDGRETGGASELGAHRMTPTFEVDRSARAPDGMKTTW